MSAASKECGCLPVCRLIFQMTLSGVGGSPTGPLLVIDNGASMQLLRGSSAIVVGSYRLDCSMVPVPGALLVAGALTLQPLSSLNVSVPTSVSGLLSVTAARLAVNSDLMVGSGGALTADVASLLTITPTGAVRVRGNGALSVTGDVDLAVVPTADSQTRLALAYPHLSVDDGGAVVIGTLLQRQGALVTIASTTVTVTHAFACDSPCHLSVTGVLTLNGTSVTTLGAPSGSFNVSGGGDVVVTAGAAATLAGTQVCYLSCRLVVAERGDATVSVSTMRGAVTFLNSGSLQFAAPADSQPLTITTTTDGRCETSSARAASTATAATATSSAS